MTDRGALVLVGALACVGAATTGMALAQSSSPVTRQVLPAVTARHAAQADLDGDGDGDLLLAGPDRLLRVLVNQETSGFIDLGGGLPRTASEGIGTRVAAADLDGDGDLDVVACGLIGTDKRRASCRVFANRLRPSVPGGAAVLRFEEVAAFGRVPPLLELAALLLADYDGDRDPDLLLFSAGTAGHLVYRNDSGDAAGPASEETEPEFALQGTGLLPGAMAMDAAILDGDRRGTEIYVSAESGADQVLVFDPDEGRWRDEASRRGVARASTGGLVAVADFDLDRRPDVFVLRPRGASSLLLQGSDGSFRDRASEAGVAGPFAVSAALIAEDFDRDRRPDIFAMNRDGVIRLLLNRAGAAVPGTAVAGLRFVDAAGSGVFGGGLAGPARAATAGLFLHAEDCDSSVHLLTASDKKGNAAILYRFPDDSAGHTIPAAREAAQTVAAFDGACVQGSEAPDRLVANRRTSILRGGAGEDTLVGSAGVTVMRGGPGADRFEAVSGYNIIRLPPEDLAPGETVVCDPRQIVVIDSPLSRAELERRGVVFQGCSAEGTCPADHETGATRADPEADEHDDCHGAKSNMVITSTDASDLQQLEAAVASKKAYFIDNGPGVGHCATHADCYAYGLDICLSDSGGPSGGDGQCYPSDFDGEGSYVTEWCDDPFWARERFTELQNSIASNGKKFVLPLVFWLPRSSALDANDQCTINGQVAPPTVADWHKSVADSMNAISALYGRWGIAFDYRIRPFTVGSGSAFVDPDNPCKTRIVYDAADPRDYDPDHPNAVVDLVTAYPIRYSDGEVNAYLVDSGLGGGESYSFGWNGGYRKFMLLHISAGAIGHEMGHELQLAHPYDGNLVRSKVTLGGISYAVVESRDSWNDRPFPDATTDRLHVCSDNDDCTGLDAPDGTCRKAPGQSKGFCQNLKLDCGQGGDHICDTPWDTAPCFGVDPLIGKRCTTDEDCHKDAGWVGTSVLSACGIFGRCYKIECTQHSDCASGFCADGNCVNKFFSPDRQTCCDIHSDELLDHNHHTCYEMLENGTVVPVPGVGDSTIWPSARTSMTYHGRAKNVFGQFTDGQRDAVVCRLGYQKKYGTIRRAALADGQPCSLRPGATSLEYGGVDDTRKVAHGACQSGVCSVDSSSILTFASCVASTCSDGVAGAGETDIDCGGVCAGKCAHGRSCRVDGDCLSGSCEGNRCQATCSDGVLNDTEMGIDKGASGSEPGCGGRGQNQTCRFGSDCAPGYLCVGSTNCVVTTDCPVNQGGLFESSCSANADCNGNVCMTKLGTTTCQVKTCSQDDDCPSKWCDSGTGRCGCDTKSDCPDPGDTCNIGTGFCRDECSDGRCLGRCMPQIVLP